MVKKLFDRNDPGVIASAKECDTVEDFVEIYRGTTTATEKALSKAYYELKHGKMAAIRMMSGSTDNDSPIEPLVGSTKEEQKKTTQKKTEIMAKKEEKKTVAQQTTPQPKRMETHNGEQVLVDADYIDPEIAKESKGATKKAATKKAATKKTSPKKDVPEVAIQSEKPTKQSKIRVLLASGATNKEIKLLLKEEGLKCYDSEILSAKTSLKNQLENKGE